MMPVKKRCTFQSVILQCKLDCYHFCQTLLLQNDGKWENWYPKLIWKRFSAMLTSGGTHLD